MKSFATKLYFVILHFCSLNPYFSSYTLNKKFPPTIGNTGVRILNVTSLLSSQVIKPLEGI